MATTNNQKVTDVGKNKEIGICVHASRHIKQHCCCRQQFSTAGPQKLKLIITGCGGAQF